MCFGSSKKTSNEETAYNVRPVQANSQNQSYNSPPAKAPMPSTYSPPAGPPPGYQSQRPNANEGYAPPAGPPPGRHNDGYAPSAGPPPGHMASQGTGMSNNPWAQHLSPQNTSHQDNYAPPAGPPPSHAASTSGYAPPPGPPPAKSHQDSYAPPSGPPPSHQPVDTYAPPPGPPPQEKPLHDWETAVPDTSLLPPPPALGEQRSWANNATEADADAAQRWLSTRPLIGPSNWPADVIEQVQSGDVELMRPAQFHGTVHKLSRGRWSITSKKGCPDSCIMSEPPVYFAGRQNPALTNRPATIYFEVKISARNAREVDLGIGFVGQPYPPFRLPGWERASLGVHGDDGHRYVNDMWGGKPFTRPYQPGETVGVGMRFSPKTNPIPPQYGQQPQIKDTVDVEVFFTRNGGIDGQWNLHEEGDSVEDRPVTGLEGVHDLWAAVGCFESIDVEVVFDEAGWMYKPE